MSIICALRVNENDTYSLTSTLAATYTAATFAEKELNLVCFTQKL